MQCLVWLCFIIVPTLVTNLFSGDYGKIPMAIVNSFKGWLIPMLIYFLNYLFLVPEFLFVNGKKGWFYFSNGGVLIAFLAYMAVKLHVNLSSEEMAQVLNMTTPEIKLPVYYIITIVCFFLAVLYSILVLISVGVRYMTRWNEQKILLKEEEKQKVEAELTWLRHQLNPHFLFNAMNNISSLTQTDPDLAQEELGRLSDVLRYSLYDAERPEVPLSGEIEFMKEYVELMKMRCNSMAKVTMQFDLPDPDSIMIAPLLFISLIENAFKHGISARQESFVHIAMYCEDSNLTFNCTNSLLEKTGVDRIGSGIGIENIRHRLQLLYPRRHNFTCGESEGAYFAEITIKGMIANG